MPVIRRYAREVAERFHPEKIILFGSYAYGTPHADSDVDLLVIMPAWDEHSKECQITWAVPPPFPLDLLVRTPKNLGWRLEERESFHTEIVTRGKVLYEAKRPKVEGDPRSASQSAPRSAPRRKRLMKRSTREWVERAEEDWITAGRMSRGKTPHHRIVCFHCQQCAEKYLKALLEEAGVFIPRVHKLGELLDLLLPAPPSLRPLRRGLSFLSKFAVDPRYPGKVVRERQAEAALRWAGRVRKAARKLLGIRPRRKRSP